MYISACACDNTNEKLYAVFRYAPIHMMRFTLKALNISERKDLLNRIC